MSNNIVEQSVKSTKGRISYGIVITLVSHPSTVLNEWALSESRAKEVSEVLTLKGDTSFSAGGLNFARRQPDDLAQAIAAAKASSAS